MLGIVCPVLEEEAARDRSDGYSESKGTGVVRVVRVGAKRMEAGGDRTEGRDVHCAPKIA